MDKEKIRKAEQFLMAESFSFTKDDVFDEDFYNLIGIYGKVKVLSLLPKVKNKDDMFSYVKICECGKREIFTGSKQNFLDYINNAYRMNNKNRFVKQLCKECIKEKTEKERKQNEYEKLKSKETSTMNFLNVLLDVDCSFNKPLKISYFRDVLNSWLWCDQDIVSTEIKNMEYRDFLNTPYWEIIAWEVKRQSNFKCSLCSSKKNLVTHHKTYKNHGYEIQEYKNDLICLCSECHEKFHEIGE